ncbi:response regulator transcription factor [Cohnella rhizosphaerae]|uniref:Response regulator n=1 Tax=Cohnella rhizosphaerae TaxID=1457232 RepID=A0A9X4L0B0_9BACL|nr:response regulator [Cohnella rhizosphaerae]MDG0813848.1 response regulator [Cohnella rhizosphaerae]
MYKIVVVEDEPLLLRSIVRSIRDAHSGFRIAGEAMNGTAALEVIAQSNPDVVFTDIRMPKMDGLSLIEALRARGNAAKIVLLSGYQDFEYAKRALRHQVEDYLLKPLSDASLKQLLEKMHGDLNRVREEERRAMLESLVESDVHDQLPQAKLQAAFAPYASYGMLLICPGSVCTFSCDWFTPAKDYWLRTDLDRIVGESIGDGEDYWIYPFNHGNEKLVVLASRQALESYATSYAAIYERLLDGNFPVTVTASRAMEALSDLPFLLQMAKIVLKKRVVFGKSGLILPDSDTEAEALRRSEASGQNLHLDAKTESRLGFFLDNRKKEPYLQEVYRLLNVYRENDAPQLLLENLLKRLAGQAQAASAVVPESRRIDLDLEIDELISNAVSYKAVKEGLTFLLEEMFKAWGGGASEGSRALTLADQADRYIRERFAERLSVQSIADHFGVVAPYLGSLYKKQKGMTPLERIIQLRIGKAKELLAIKPPIPLKDIADAVGYDDPYYLSRLFKSVTGASPSEYRETHTKGDRAAFE